MKTSDFNYDLPSDLIAQHPVANRDTSRMMVVNKQTGEIAEHSFCKISRFLSAGDVVVINDSKVIPARVFGKKDTGATIEVFLLKKVDDDFWEALLKPAKRVKVGSII
ncbi:MAG: S-adenosylmethionine:tRNA ribosyltransferase-isomerase, partial [Deltaproteobacteria bacterium]